MKAIAIHHLEDNQHYKNFQDHCRLLSKSVDLTEVLPGDVTAEKLFGHDLILVFVSVDLLSDENSLALIAKAEEQKESGARVVPILIRECSWTGHWLHKLKWLPENGKAVGPSANQDQAWTEVCEALLRIAKAQPAARVVVPEPMPPVHPLHPQVPPLHPKAPAFSFSLKIRIAILFSFALAIAIAIVGASMLPMWRPPIAVDTRADLALPKDLAPPPDSDPSCRCTSLPAGHDPSGAPGILDGHLGKTAQGRARLVQGTEGAKPPPNVHTGRF